MILSMQSWSLQVGNEQTSKIWIQIPVFMIHATIITLRWLPKLVLNYVIMKKTSHNENRRMRK